MKERLSIFEMMADRVKKLFNAFNNTRSNFYNFREKQTQDCQGRSLRASQSKLSIISRRCWYSMSFPTGPLQNILTNKTELLRDARARTTVGSWTNDCANYRNYYSPLESHDLIRSPFHLAVLIIFSGNLI